MEITQEMVLSIAGIITAVGGAWLTVRKIAKDAKKEQNERDAKILQLAKEALAIKEKEFNHKIKAAEEKIAALEESVNKDLSHIRETYNGEIRNLSQKIEDLRVELRNQHGSLVTLLTKLIESKED